jgi:hypothetical protein
LKYEYRANFLIAITCKTRIIVAMQQTKRVGGGAINTGGRCFCMLYDRVRLSVA